MNRKLLTGLTLASVAGTGGAAYATVAGPADTAPPPASAGPLVTAGETSTTAATTTTSAAITTSTTAAVGRTISYQVGDAGTVTVDVAGSVMTSRGLVPASGWNIGAMSNSTTHIDVQFANSERIVGFSADLVGADVVVSVTNDRLPGASGAAGPLVVSVIGGSGSPSTVPAPSFDTVVPATPAPAPVTTPAPVAPPAASTSAPSSAGKSGDDDGEYEGNEGGHSSHSDESEGGDDD